MLRFGERDRQRERERERERNRKRKVSCCKKTYKNLGC